ncbi:sigma-54-dependent transcriptional regulator [Sinanaerobacter chloroacetimidivorans]|uniref:Stage 0 sporulation protein A homolog n=1 Tax=Sinanaerobacter chloroacetimidivorans TaxID=2818044 RepID=A0A8J7W5T2_9FIRM|nr:sigma-54 dependent transcriptional regulator [Sinanaerobacter chloroacetimidivorans]MBR0599613.1 sigma-54-dependent Fis family transcriptional regulator [Sinanaerobacter chloroacetimidivorans]
MKRILMIDDDLSFLKIYSEILKGSGYDTVTAYGGPEALELLEEEYFDIVITDVAMPEMNGIEVLKRIKGEYPSTLVMMLTGEGSISGAVEAMELGAYTYLIKPLEIDQLLLNIKRALEYLELNSENQQLKSRISSLGHEGRLIGSSAPIAELREQIMKTAPTNANVLITGESGTGKEIIADLLHENGLNKGGPMIKVNCAALAESVLESEIFGHEKGAFTGALAAKPGRFELARGGTLFLDEIGELSLKLQSKLLRVLQEKEFERVGGTKTIKVDFRLIAATNRELSKEVEKGTFREDLYYRINVVPLVSPPLRERTEDIPVLLEHYLEIYCKELKKAPVKVTEQAMEILKKYHWKGNVRELKNLTERLVVFSDGRDINAEMLPEEIRGQGNWSQDFRQMDFQEAKRYFEKEYLSYMLKKNQWNISVTAEEIKIARKNLQLKIKQLNIRKDTKK